MEGIAANEAETKMPALGGHFWGRQYATKAASNLLNWCGDRSRINTKAFEFDGYYPLGRGSLSLKLSPAYL